MAKEISNNLAYKASDKGMLLGELSPNKESKGAWSELYLYNSSFIACIYADTTDCELIYGEEISFDEIEKYVEDIEKAQLILKEKGLL